MAEIGSTTIVVNVRSGCGHWRADGQGNKAYCDRVEGHAGRHASGNKWWHQGAEGLEYPVAVCGEHLADHVSFKHISLSCDRPNGHEGLHTDKGWCWATGATAPCPMRKKVVPKVVSWEEDGLRTSLAFARSDLAVMRQERDALRAGLDEAESDAKRAQADGAVLRQANRTQYKDLENSREATRELGAKLAAIRKVVL